MALAAFAYRLRRFPLPRSTRRRHCIRRAAFPDTCAYTLQIDAFKRTIADCGYWLPYRNRSQFSLTVIV